MKVQTVMRQVPISLEIEQYDGITKEMKERMTEYLLSLYGIKESTKDDYLSKIKMLGKFRARFVRKISGLVMFCPILNYWKSC